MSLEFSLLQCLTTTTRSALSPDEQICEMVKRLDGKIKNWQVIAPNPMIRVLYFEPDEGQTLKPEEGSQLDNREIALGGGALNPKNSKSKKSNKNKK